jgi:hypothetical protein
MDLKTEMRTFVRRRLDRWNQRGRLDELPEVEREAGFEEFLTHAPALTHTLGPGVLGSYAYRSASASWGYASPGPL